MSDAGIRDGAAQGGASTASSAASDARADSSDLGGPNSDNADADAVAPASVDAGAGAGPMDGVASCPASALTSGDHDGSVQFQGHGRDYLLHVPKSYSGRVPVPLVFDFHGYGQSVTSQMRASGFADLAEQHGFVAVYPAGVGGSWNVNGCCGQAGAEMLDEIGAVRAILAQVAAEVCVDAKRVYASGISQGGGMAHHVGCLAADIFAAVAPVSSDLRTDPCAPARPVAELSFRGTADSLSPYEGGAVGPLGMQYTSIGAAATLERWKTIDQCSGEPEVEDEICRTYKQCAAGVEVTLCSIPGGGHALYENPSGFSIAEHAWRMFERQSLP